MIGNCQSKRLSLVTQRRQLIDSHGAAHRDVTGEWMLHEVSEPISNITTQASHLFIPQTVNISDFTTKRRFVTRTPSIKRTGRTFDVHELNSGS
jgi:hypothetical protein